MFVEGRNQRDAARFSGLSRETVAKMCLFSLPPGCMRTKPVGKPKLGPLLLPVSSGEALLATLAAVPEDIAARLRGARILAASERLAALAREAGCTDVRIADGPRPAQLLACAARDG